MLGINLSPQIYHHFFSLGFKFKENNENDMTFVVWAGTVFGPHLWQLSARSRSLAGSQYLKQPWYVVNICSRSTEIAKKMFHRLKR